MGKITAKQIHSEMTTDIELNQAVSNLTELINQKADINHTHDDISGLKYVDLDENSKVPFKLGYDENGVYMIISEDKNEDNN